MKVKDDKIAIAIQQKIYDLKNRVEVLFTPDAGEIAEKNVEQSLR